ncbi:MAG: hypothetical protein [Olavius algarvensis Gamma 1 endosymbiont]|nr:MAG: hypothetical protein [Olavius algarvensis Gamma 1 endosymbiont]
MKFINIRELSTGTRLRITNLPSSCSGENLYALVLTRSRGCIRSHRTVE